MYADWLSPTHRQKCASLHWLTTDGVGRPKILKLTTAIQSLYLKFAFASQSKILAGWWVVSKKKLTYVESLLSQGITVRHLAISKTITFQQTKKKSLFSTYFTHSAFCYAFDRYNFESFFLPPNGQQQWTTCLLCFSVFQWNWKDASTLSCGRAWWRAAIGQRWPRIQLIGALVTWRFSSWRSCIDPKTLLRLLRTTQMPPKKKKQPPPPQSFHT